MMTSCVYLYASFTILRAYVYVGPVNCVAGHASNENPPHVSMENKKNINNFSFKKCTLSGAMMT